MSEEQQAEYLADWPKCGCLYCDCPAGTEYGEQCSNCSAGEHLGTKWPIHE